MLIRSRDAGRFFDFSEGECVVLEDAGYEYGGKVRYSQGCDEMRVHFGS